MTLHDISNGPMWITWVALALLVIMTIVLLSGKGSGLVAGFNTMSKEEIQQSALRSRRTYIANHPQKYVKKNV